MRLTAYATQPAEVARDVTFRDALRASAELGVALALAVGVGACRGTASTATSTATESAAATATPTAALVARLAIARPSAPRDADVVVDVEIVNVSARPVTIAAQELEAPALLLEVRDARGARVPTMPPPVPRGDSFTLAPGGHKKVSLGLAMFSPPLAPGDYTVLPRGGIAGDAVPFRISPRP